MSLSTTLLIVISVMFALFWFWYTGGQKPLTKQEIDTYMPKLRKLEMNEAVLARIHQFMMSDTGKGFVMVNLLKLNDTESGKPSAEETLQKYSHVFLRKLLLRAGHPIAIGQVAGDAVELWGLQDDAKWTTVGLIRYRSRRDMIEMVVDPTFTEIHPFKEQALQKTIAVPVAPWFSLSDLRLIVGLIAIIAGLGILVAV